MRLNSFRSSRFSCSSASVRRINGSWYSSPLLARNCLQYSTTWLCAHTGIVTWIRFNPLDSSLCSHLVCLFTPSHPCITPVSPSLHTICARTLSSPQWNQWLELMRTRNTPNTGQVTHLLVNLTRLPDSTVHPSRLGGRKGGWGRERWME